MRCFSKAAALIAAAALLALAGCSPPKDKGPSPLTLYFTCDTDGRSEPCGCFTGQYGGLSRVKQYLAQQPADRPILVDVGNAIEGAEDYQILKYRYLQKAFASMNFAALNLGGREARLSAKQIRELAAASAVPMISANLLDAASGRRLCEPYRIVERDGYRIGLVGVVDCGKSDDVGEGIIIEPVETALSKLLPGLRGQADLLVLLAFADETELSELAKRFYEFDLILGGRVRQPSQHLLKENRSVILYTTNESKALGVLKAVITGPSRLTSPEFDIALMSPEIPQAESILQQSVAYRDEIRRTRLNVDDPDHARDDQVPGVHEAGRYLGSTACAACHVAEYLVWAKSGHAHAFESLAARHFDADPTCIGCHTVGFGSASGYRRELSDKQLTSVGCESCHGPGSEHVAQRKSNVARFKFRPLTASDCTRCHHGEFSRPFEWNDFWPAVEHGKSAAASKRSIL